ncbi:MAG TPA: hypothetical protein VH988_09495 [Thermoanaerobaculia bacterium]|jgi:hypothetical protein|nr:hypothetical protein [Thermoanaerobaculia bacterium]
MVGSTLGTAGSGKGGYLLMRHGGALWGVENAAVVSLTRGGEGGGRFLVAVGAGEPAGELGIDLWIDEIVGVVAELAVRPLTAALRRFWPEAAGGLAVHAEMPLVVVDPRRPPRALRGALPDAGGDVGRVGRDGDGEGAHRNA